jgi:hypothetical protein
MTIGTTDTYWRRIYVDSVAPPGTVTVRIMAWSLMTNVGTAYFDSFYVVDSKLENAGFEENLGMIPTHWQSPNTVPTVDRVHVRTGIYSLRLVDGSATDPMPAIYSDPYPCVGGARYRVAGWLYVESTSEGGWGQPYALSIVFYHSVGQTTSYRVHGGGVGMWDYLAVEAIAPFDCVNVRILFTSSQINVGTSDLDDVELLLAPAGLDADSSIWAVTIHGNLGVPDSVTPTSDLGIGHQRWDWWWASSYLLQGNINWGLMGQRRVYLRTANQVGIDVIIIVGGSLGARDNTPGWVNDNNFAQEWYAFCEMVGQEFGASAYWYQLANEQNHWAHERFDDATVFNQCFTALRNSDSVSEPANHEWFFRSIVNAATYGPANWQLDLFVWLANAGSSIDVVAIDHYPGEWSGGPSDEDWSHLEWLGDFVVVYGKLAAVMETGRSTASPCDQNCQANWILSNIRDHVRPIVQAQNTDHHNNRFVLLAWFELWDYGEGIFASQFGLMTKTYSHKASYATFQSEAFNYVGPPFHS